METWKPIPDFPNNQISSYGNVKGAREKELKTWLRNGYKSVSLYYKGRKHTFNIHRLVAENFIANDLNKECVNHIDGDKQNNNMSNLEWCSPKENTKHALENNLAKKSKQPVIQFTLDGKYIQQFNSIKEAEYKTGISNKHISSVCKGSRNQTGGFKWLYVKKQSSTQIPLDSKQIVDFPNYLIDRNGDIYSKKSKKIMTPKVLLSGLKTIKLCNNGVSKDLYINKLLREHFNS